MWKNSPHSGLPTSSTNHFLHERPVDVDAPSHRILRIMSAATISVTTLGIENALQLVSEPSLSIFECPGQVCRLRPLSVRPGTAGCLKCRLGRTSPKFLPKFWTAAVN